MPIQLFPEPSTSSINADSYTVPTALKQYKIVKNFDAAVYTVTTSPSNSQATVKFLTSNSVLSATTISGTVTYNLASNATGAFVEVSSSTDVVVTISKVASALSGSAISGTLDTITSTQTYNQTGPLYVFVVGGGAGGANGVGGTGPGTTGGSGGGAGSINQGLFYLNTSTSITIGSGGNSDSSGGTTNFGNLLSASGGNVGQSGSAGIGNTPWNTALGSANPGSATSNPYSTISIGTNGGGGSGSAYSPGAGGGGGGPGGSGGGSGIGTGGAGGNSGAGPTANVGSNATGYGAGGGGGAGASNGGNGGTGTGNRSGGAGSSGVVYVLRGF